MCAFVIVQVDPDIVWRGAQRWRAAIYRALWSIEKLAIHCGVDKSQLRREIDEGRLPMKRIEQFPPDVRGWHSVLTLEEVGVPDVLLRAEPVIKMAKMTLAPINPEEKKRLA
jgi:hypothetical protein